MKKKSSCDLFIDASFPLRQGNTSKIIKISQQEILAKNDSGNHVNFKTYFFVWHSINSLYILKIAAGNLGTLFYVERPSNFRFLMQLSDEIFERGR